MSSYTPFLTETLYQGLREFIPTDGKEDVRSVHFLPFPEFKSEYFDEDIERSVQRMQAVIELTRTIRERHQLSLKTPLKELVIFHPDNQFHEDTRPLVRYIQSELNVRDVVFTADEALSGVQYKASADWPTLGKKLRKDIGRVKAGLPKLTSDDVKQYVQTGKISIDGIELVTGDLQVSRFVELPADGQRATNTDNDVVVILDIQLHPELETEGLSRELINRVQKLRKKAGLQATDDVLVFYAFEEGDGQVLTDAIEKHKEVISKTCRGIPVNVAGRQPNAVILIEEEQEIAETKFMLSLVRV